MIGYLKISIIYGAVFVVQVNKSPELVIETLLFTKVGYMQTSLQKACYSEFLSLAFIHTRGFVCIGNKFISLIDFLWVYL